MKDTRYLQDLVSVGKATLMDFEMLGITRVEQLVGKDPAKLVKKLEKIKGARMDPCCEDVFRAAVAQAENPNLPDEQKRWHYWSRVRKEQSKR